jgi:hypothetical protein
MRFPGNLRVSLAFASSFDVGENMTCIGCIGASLSSHGPGPGICDFGATDLIIFDATHFSMIFFVFFSTVISGLTTSKSSLSRAYSLTDATVGTSGQ